MRLHHVQVACPPGGEDVARAFYSDALGLVEVEKPEVLRARGGAWFRAYDADGGVTAEIHVGVEDQFASAHKAHPALLVEDDAAFEALAHRLRTGGYRVHDQDADTFPGYRRMHSFDGHENRFEILVARH